MYAILKHLLAPGRYYTFRVAAVNTYGSLGFSKSSEPFKLSKGMKKFYLLVLRFIKSNQSLKLSKNLQEILTF